jgi:hypothetical protein
MTRPLVKVHNIFDDTQIIREMNDDEYAVFLKEKAKFEEEAMLVAEIAQKKAQAQAKLAALGLTADDLKALGL